MLNPDIPTQTTTCFLCGSFSEAAYSHVSGSNGCALPRTQSSMALVAGHIRCMMMHGLMDWAPGCGRNRSPIANLRTNVKN